MQSEGATYDNAFVVDSLCCPSRASIFTGQAPHQTGVLTNTPNDYGSPIGGFEAFAANGNLKRAFRSEEHTSELQSLMRISYAVFCLKKKTQNSRQTTHN